MNIFVVDTDPVVAARSLCDKHVVKMVLESAQLLSTAVHMLSSDFVDSVYKPSHVMHPCSVWTRTSRSNFRWLGLHARGLAAEYERRYEKTHKSLCIINAALQLESGLKFPGETLTPPSHSVYEECKAGTVVESYRRYYHIGKAYFARWDYCEPPGWWDPELAALWTWHTPQHRALRTQYIRRLENA